jgi:pimeloyl-ACP methyl ester carboxylesterase
MYTTRPRPQLLLSLTSIAIALCTLIFGLGLLASASKAATSSPKPTIVLVHGAWADSSGWNDVIGRLQDRGFTVIAPANPLRGVSADAAYLSSVLATVEGPIVLVGHSYGGMVITNAATGKPNVKALVYIAAFAPDSGDSVGGLGAMNPGSELGTTTLLFRPFPGGIDAYIQPASFRDVFAGDIPAAQTALMAVEQRPISTAALGEPSGPPAWTAIPSWYLVAKQDHAIPPATERFMAARAHATTVEVKSSHAVMVSHPDAVADLILTAALATA